MAKKYKSVILNAEYRTAYNNIALRLSADITDDQELRDIMDYVEEVLVKSQYLGVLPHRIYGDHGIEGFCQNIIDDRPLILASLADTAPTSDDRRGRRRGRGSRGPYATQRRSVPRTILGVFMLIVLIAVLLGVCVLAVLSFINFYHTVLSNIRF